ncbi:MAG: DUF3553 domain-containing protein [Lachnospiraceae bacterium]|jgi:DNA helicase-2/ATP-dependent DNA helicase PcrA|nr:DUF3553 domain-containing protein [Lachnospiraceae bacterium]
MSIYDKLNENQREGVMSTEGPVLLLAGAGSGKTRVLTTRVAYLIEEKGVNPANILAITFTNKAAAEMKERIANMVGIAGGGIWVMTFHAACVRILKSNADKVGYDSSFTIYDSDDQKTLMREILKRLQIDTKVYRERYFLNAISNGKNELLSPEAYRDRVGNDFAMNRIADVYKEYQDTLRKNNAMDFDDLIMKTVELFANNQDVLNYYQEKFRYIMVDEYQDTNSAQFALVSKLAAKYRNICVVGDDDQSIYRFRGANIRNILDFEHFYPEATVIKLEQNYRSTQTILDAANAVISNNESRKDKKLWTDKGAGNPIHFRQFENAYGEAEFICDDIQKKEKEGVIRYSDCAVLFRTNAQTRLVEERFVVKGVPYDIVGGVNFYARREIKDLLAYLKTVANGRDDVAVKRIINVPRRGIGETSIDKITNFAAKKNISFFDAMCEADLVSTLGKAEAKVRAFTAMIEHFREVMRETDLLQLITTIINETEYIQSIEYGGEEDAVSRVENIDELVSKIVSFEENNQDGTLTDFLNEVALVADIDFVAGDSGRVLLMTLHSAKGLEFPHVYIAGMEDGVFPSYLSLEALDPESEIEEERRLAYVGITRARECLTLTCAKQRMLRGQTFYNSISRFLREIPSSLLDTRIGAFRKMKVTVPVKKYTSPENRPYIAGGAGALQGSGIGQGIPSLGQNPDYQAGDRVTHIKYGMGTVQKIEQGAKDYQVTVEFDTAGQKIMYAAFAKLKKI